MGRLKFFNVFGPNEYHKGTMMSVLARRFDDIRAGQVVELFKRTRWHRRRRSAARFHLCRRCGAGDDVAAGDAVGLGIFNVGTGKARSFKDLMLSGHARSAQLRIFVMSTCPNRSATATSIYPKRCRSATRAGYNGGFTALEEPVASTSGLPRSRRIASADGAGV